MALRAIALAILIAVLVSTILHCGYADDLFSSKRERELDVETEGYSLDMGTN
jgi:hypothetical protein